MCSQLRRLGILAPKDMLVIDPAVFHGYYGYSTMIAGGYLGDSDEAVNKYARLLARPAREVFPKGVKILPTLAKTFFPEQNRLITESGDEIKYEYLVVSPGLRHNFEIIEGARKALADPECNVASIFDGLFGGRKMNRIRTKLNKGVAVFANAPLPAKCGGAPLKVCLLVEDYLRKSGKRKNVDVHFFNTTDLLFPVPYYGKILRPIVESRGIHLHLNQNLKSIDKEKGIATFVSTVGEKTETRIRFDSLHIAPHFQPLKHIRTSPFVDSNGFIMVNPATLQSKKYTNVLALGDGIDLNISKTASAITVQAPVVVHNLGQLLRGKKPNAIYNGYSVCPVFTGRDRMLFCETLFREPYHSYFMANSRPKWWFYFVSRYLMPWFYWMLIPHGLWYGKRFIFRPRFD